MRVERGGLDGQRLDLPDANVDSVLSTLTLCTIPDAEAALHEVVRVLRPGGALHFFEHGLAPDTDVERWQHRLEPLQMRVFDGCHLTRRIDRLVEGSGLVMEWRSAPTRHRRGSCDPGSTATSDGPCAGLTGRSGVRRETGRASGVGPAGYLVGMVDQGVHDELVGAVRAALGRR